MGNSTVGDIIEDICSFWCISILGLSVFHSIGMNVWVEGDRELFTFLVFKDRIEYDCGSLQKGYVFYLNNRKIHVFSRILDEKKVEITFEFDSTVVSLSTEGYPSETISFTPTSKIINSLDKAVLVVRTPGKRKVKILDKTENVHLIDVLEDQSKNIREMLLKKSLRKFVKGRLFNC